MKKEMRKKGKKNIKWSKTTVVIICILIFTCLSSSEFALAGLVTFQKEYTYQASEADSKLSCRTISLEQVKRLLLEELGTYLESETEVKNFQLTKDQITVLTAGIVSVEVINERWDGRTYYLKAKITADPKEVANSIEKLRQDRQKMKDLEETRKKADEALREIEKLKKELETAKAGKIEQDKYKKAVNGLSATDWFGKGYALNLADKHQAAIEAYIMAIELDPKYAKAYQGRGLAYGQLENYQQAIRDFNMAIELDPKYAVAYSNRGNAYAGLGDNRQAIRDYDRAIELWPKFLEAKIRKRKSSVKDYLQVIRHSDRAIELDAKYATSYNDRGVAYHNLGDYRQAIRDYDRAIELDPKYATAYYNRGIAYGVLKEYLEALQDYQNAARLGSKAAQDFLMSKGINW